MKASLVLKLLIVVIAGVALYLYYDHTRSVAAATREYNRIVTTLINQQKHAEAVDALERLLPSAPEDMKPDICTDIARQCAIVGDDPGLPIAESAKWFRKAESYDPSVLNEQQRQILNLSEP